MQGASLLLVVGLACAAAAYRRPDTVHPTAWNSGYGAVQHECDGPTCTVNEATGYFNLTEGSKVNPILTDAYLAC